MGNPQERSGTVKKVKTPFKALGRTVSVKRRISFSTTAAAQQCMGNPIALFIFVFIKSIVPRNFL
jgi:hypothetical protein